MQVHNYIIISFTKLSTVNLKVHEYSKFLKLPPSAWTHAITHHSTEQLMFWYISILLLIVAVASFIHYNNTCLVSSLPVSYTL